MSRLLFFAIVGFLRGCSTPACLAAGRVCQDSGSFRRVVNDVRGIFSVVLQERLGKIRIIFDVRETF